MIIIIFFEKYIQYLISVFHISGALAWNGDILSSGSRDRIILQRDVRSPSIVPERKLAGHKQEVGYCVLPYHKMFRCSG